MTSLMQNMGWLEGSGTENLWGAENIPYEVVLPSGDWRPFPIIGEKQKDPAETMSCTTQATLNSLEVQEKQQTGIEPNWSDRYIAKLSGTTSDGNFSDKPPEAVRKYGVVKQEDWPVPPNYNWNSYYAEIPQNVLDKEVKREIAYAGIAKDKASLLYHLKQAPIKIVIPEPHPNHEVLLLHIEGDTGHYFDSYAPFNKTIPLNKIHYAMKVVLKGVQVFPTKKVKVNGSYGVLIDTPNMTNITKAEDEAEWRSYSKSDSYKINSVNPDGSTNWDIDLEINF
jgi:hypothetical protein